MINYNNVCGFKAYTNLISVTLIAQKLGKELYNSNIVISLDVNYYKF